MKLESNKDQISALQKSFFFTEWFFFFWKMQADFFNYLMEFLLFLARNSPSGLNAQCFQDILTY